MEANGLLRPDKMDYWQSRDAQGLRNRGAWELLIAQTGENGIMITLGFNTYMDDGRATAVANHFLQRLNRRLFGKRFIKHSNGLHGIVVLELKRRSTRSCNSPHFHFVVSETIGGRPLPAEAIVRAAVQRESSRLRYPTLDNYRSIGGVISGPDFVDVRRIYEPFKLGNYLTKECSAFGSVGDALNIGFVTIRGIEGLSDSLPKLH